MTEHFHHLYEQQNSPEEKAKRLTVGKEYSLPEFISQFSAYIKETLETSENETYKTTLENWEKKILELLYLSEHTGIPIKVVRLEQAENNVFLSLDYEKLFKLKFLYKPQRLLSKIKDILDPLYDNETAMQILKKYPSIIAKLIIWEKELLELTDKNIYDRSKSEIRIGFRQVGKSYELYVTQ